MKRYVLLTLMVGVVSCNLPTSSIATPPTPSPAPSPTSVPDYLLQITGGEEVVFDWTTDRCEDENIPDLPVRAFRDAKGQVQLLISHYVNYRMLGPGLDELKMDCNPVLKSTRNSDAAFFTDAEWIESVYTEDGGTIYAILHNEHHGYDHPGQCDLTLENWWFTCWYNTETLAVSRDGGASYEHAAEPPNHLIASLPQIFEPDAGPYGVMNASNIIKKDGFYYAFIRLDLYRSDTQRTCLMRTSDLADPVSWRFWDGRDFVGEFENPYMNENGGSNAKICSPIDQDDIGVGMVESLTYNTFINRYVLLGLSADHIDGREVWGIYYAFSDDLIHWDRRKLLREIPLPWTVAKNTDTFYLYPALIDPRSQTLNFEDTGKTGYVYYTRLNFGAGSLDRDLIRIPVEFTLEP